MGGHKVLSQENKEGKHIDIDNVDIDTSGKSFKFKEVLERFSGRTSMHGCGYIGSSRHTYSRLFWIFLTVSAVAVLVLHLYSIAYDYFQWPILTKVSLGFSNLQFPAITICNANVMKNHAIKKYGSKQLTGLVEYLDPSAVIARNSIVNGTEELVSEVEELVSEAEELINSTGLISNISLPLLRKKRFVSQLTNTNISMFDDDFDEAEDVERDEPWNTNMDVTSQLNELFSYLYMQIDRDTRIEYGHNMKDMILQCSFNGRECFPENFSLYSTATYGNCWTMDSSKMVARSSGPSSGLSLVLYLQTNRYISGLSTGYGARVVIHKPGSKPLPDDEGAFVSAAAETNIGLKKTLITRLGTPHGKCEDGTDFKTTYGCEYSISMCNAVCKFNAILEKCGCYHHLSEELYWNAKPEKTQCKSAKERNCMNKEVENFRRRTITCSCDNPCDDTTYTMGISSRQWPTDGYALLLKQSVCESHPEECIEVQSWEEPANNFLKLNIYYETLNYESITETPAISVFTFLASIGGALGLWIGLSMLSLCEIFQLIGEVMRHILCHRPNRVHRG